MPDRWDDAAALKGADARNDQNLPIAIESETAFYFRDVMGKLVHRYPFADQHYDVSFLRHYLTYITKSSVRLMPPQHLKYKLLWLVRQCLVKLAAAGRKRVTVLEIGSTIGENYRLIQTMLGELGLSMDVDFVGVELSPSLVQFSNIVNRGDERFKTIIGDASDLSRFPDGCFDLVLNQGVANFVNDQKRAFAEIVRVARVAVVMGVQLTLEPQPFYLTRDIGYSTFLPTQATLDEIWRPFAPLHDYMFARMPWTQTSTSGSGADRFIGVDPAAINSVFEYHILARHPLFPELSKLCRTIAS